MKHAASTIAAGLLLALGAMTPAFAGPPAESATAFASQRFAVEVRGRGPDVILIPGLSSSPAVWARTAEALDDTHRVHLVHVNGFAGRVAGANKAGPVFLPLRDELARYIAQRGLKRPAVIGHSMGGALALSLAASAPEQVGRVMAVDALPFVALLMGPGSTPETVKPRAEAMRTAMSAITPEQHAAAAPATLAGLVKNPAAREQGVKDSVASDPAVVTQVVYDMMVTDLRPSLAKSPVPITVLYAFDAGAGAPEALVDGLWEGAYAGVPGAKLVRVDGSRHFIMDDQPDRFAAEVQAFLAAP